MTQRIRFGDAFFFFLFSLGATSPILARSPGASIPSGPWPGAIASGESLEIPARAPASPVVSDTLVFGYFTTIGEDLYAVEGETWTWDHGSPDPFEGWYATDLSADLSTYFRQISSAVWSGHGNLVSAPVLSGGGSAWLGAFEDEAREMCWSTGLGYGDQWCQKLVSPTLTYTGSGTVGLSFQYFVDCEFGYDYARAMLVVNGEMVDLNPGGFTGQYGTPPAGPWATYSRNISQSELGGPGARPFAVVFEFNSDASWSDQDGYYPTDYGPFGIDDVLLSGSIAGGSQAYGFESGLQGWVAQVCPGISSFFALHPLGEYQLADVCACGLQDNVVAFHDPSYQHPQEQHVQAWSPVVDRSSLQAYNVISARWAQYSDLPLGNGVFFRPGWRYFPYICPSTGDAVWSGRKGRPEFIYTGDAPLCHTGTDVATSHGIPPGCDLVGFVYEIYSSCDAFGIPPTQCTGTTNFSPLLDNVQIRLTRGLPAVPSDVSLALISAPGTLEEGVPSPLRVTLQNLGTQATDVTVIFTARSQALPGLADQDMDGWVDLAEDALGSNPTDQCNTPESAEVLGSCTDGIDNDLDGLTDFADPGCMPQGPDGEGCFRCTDPCPPGEDGPASPPIPSPVPPDGNGSDSQLFNPLVPTSVRDMVIDEAHGRGSNYDWSDIIALAEAFGLVAGQNNTTHRREIKRDMKSLNRNDILIYEGHANDCNGDGVVDGLAAPSGLWGWGGGRAISENQMQAWLSGDGKPPGLLLLSGCKTADLFPKATAAGVKVVIGFTQSVPAGTAVGAEKELMKKLLTGSTLQQALDAANAYLAAKDNGVFNPNNARMSSGGTLGGAGGMTLDQILGNEELLLAAVPALPLDEDSDGDGIEDEVDDCPLVPEDFDYFEDLDGCPETNPETHHDYFVEWSPHGPLTEAVRSLVAPDFLYRSQVLVDTLQLPPGSSVIVELNMTLDCFDGGTHEDSVIVAAVASGDPNLSNNRVGAQVQLDCVTSGVKGPERSVKGDILALRANPGRGRVVFNLDLPRAWWIKLEVFDSGGRMLAKIADSPLSAGPHVLTWIPKGPDGIPLPPGMYFYRLRCDGRAEPGKFVLLAE